jgi:pyruvate-formate lyase-activating enzyme
MKCNLDCSYCKVGIHGGHDNSLPHPDYNKCIQTIDFMFSYVDLYMQYRSKAFKHVVLNVYGGESLHHPRIVDILQQVKEKYKSYQDRWSLKITCTTNAIIKRQKLSQIIPYIDEFTVSYHSEISEKYKELFRQNLLTIKEFQQDLKCVVLMHSDSDLFEDSQNMITWLKDNNIRHLPRQLDHYGEVTELNYTDNQVVWFKKLYKDKSYNGVSHDFIPMRDINNRNDLDSTGRACCGGRQLCQDQDYSRREFFVSNNFKDWHCAVNHFFLFVKQVNGEVYVNKDCKMNFQGQIGPIGNLDNADKILSTLVENLNTNMPVIQCKKERCYCGLCAPKAKDIDTYNQIMKKYLL